MARRPRLDVWLVERGLFPSRERARQAVMAGLVYVDGRRADKPGMPVRPDAHVEVRGDPIPYVSRGGLKLEGALDAFAVDVRGLVCLDVGASTGGFTDCLLRRGAARVYAVDVGYGQLAWSLRNDPRVVVLERTNIRYLEPERLGEPVDLATVDVSFISLTKVWGPVARLLKPGGQVIALVKPQFEAGPERVGKGGVVRDPAVHLECLARVSEAATSSGFDLHGVTHSPIKGPEGNIEFFLHVRLSAGGRGGQPGAAPEDWPERLAAAVARAHAELAGTPSGAMPRRGGHGQGEA